MTVQLPCHVTLAQMGGISRLQAMVRARNFVHQNEGRVVSFKFSGSRKVNYCKITLDPSDTYTVEFGKVARYDYREISTQSLVYADQLKALFEATTGLYLSV